MRFVARVVPGTGPGFVAERRPFPDLGCLIFVSQGVRAHEGGKPCANSHCVATSSISIDPTSLEWTEQELRRQVRSLMVETETRENAKDAERKAREAREAAQQPPIARRTKSSRRQRSSASRRRKSSATSRRTSGTRVARQAQSTVNLWLVFGALAAGLLGLVAIAL